MSETYFVIMRHSETREIRRAGPYPFAFSYFWWTDGNFGCGCNRQAEWHRAAPDYASQDWQDTDEDYIHPIHGRLFGECSDTRYEALYAILPDGSRVGIDEG